MIVVTGASKGLGAAIVKRLNDSGTATFSLARSIDPNCGHACACDVSDYAQVKSAAAAIKATGQTVRAVVNAAGIASMNLALTTPPSMTQKLIATNLMGTIYVSQLLAPLMIRQKTGRIINFSTIAVALGLRGESIYAASKAGVEGFSRAFAREMSDFNIQVNCIAPGPIKTDLIKGVSEAQIDKIIRQQVIPKAFAPDDVCDLVELLLDPRSNSISGQTLHVGGA